MSDNNRHYFIGQYYPVPKKGDEPGFKGWDDFKAEELEKINVSSLQFKYNHKDLVIGKLFHGFRVKDGSSYVLGFIDTSTPVGKFLASEMDNGNMRELSMGHRFSTHANTDTFILEHHKEPLEVSLVNTADFHTCKILQSVSEKEIQRRVPILTKRLETEYKQFKDDFVKSTLASLNDLYSLHYPLAIPLLGSQMSSTPITQPTAAATPPAADPTTIPSNSAPVATNTTNNNTTPTSIPAPSATELGKRSAESSASNPSDEVAQKRQKLTGEMLEKMAAIATQPKNIQEEMLNQLLGHIARSKEEEAETLRKAKLYDEQEAQRQNAEKEVLNKLRDQFVMSLANGDAAKAKPIENGLNEMLNSFMTAKSASGISTVKPFLEGLVAHSVQEAKKSADLEVQMKKAQQELDAMKQRAALAGYLHSNPISSSYLPQSAPQSTTSFFSPMNATTPSSSSSAAAAAATAVKDPAFSSAPAQSSNNTIANNSSQSAPRSDPRLLFMEALRGTRNDTSAAELISTKDIRVPTAALDTWFK